MMSDAIDDESVCIFCEDTCATPGWERFDVEDLVGMWRAICRESKSREDSVMSTGTISITLPVLSNLGSVYHPSSEVGALFIGEGHLIGDTIEVSLEAVASLVFPNSPWEVARHCTHSRRIANRERDRLRREARAERRSRKEEIRAIIVRHFGLTAVQGDGMMIHNWDSRVEVESPKFLDDALALYRALPGADGNLVDRRRLGQEVLGNPHALDSRRPLASFLLDLLIVTGVATPRMRPREAWRRAGVLGDGVHDGMAVVGVSPVGMVLDDGLLVVLPPRTLETAVWPVPVSGREDVFLTENPSILEAAMGIEGLQMMCTLGTVSDSPTSEMLAALVRMGERGYRLHVRGDFDSFGLEHVGTLLATIPGAVPWRMGAADYLEAVASGAGPALSEKFPLDASWDTRLACAMKERGLAGNEEALLEVLLDDLEQAFSPAMSHVVKVPTLVGESS